MTWTTSCPSTAAKVAVLICFFWPWVALSFLQPRGRSSGPVAAMIVPLAVGAAGMWVDLYQTMWGMAAAGSAPHAASAGIAEALGLLTVGGLFAGFTAVAALIRRHRTFLDRFAAGLMALLVVQLAGAVVLAMTIGRARWQFDIAIAVVLVSSLVAIAAAVRAWSCGRGRVQAVPLRYGVPVAVAVFVASAVVLWQQVDYYRTIAWGGQGPMGALLVP